MDFLFNVLFLCTAAGAAAEIQTVCFVNIEYREGKRLILNQVKRVSHLYGCVYLCISLKMML
jgi:hypothetical protein